MKKNIRIASILLVIVLATSCFVGTTFAKYVKSGSTSDSARVAKWGVTINAEAATDVFVDTYATDNNEVVATIANSVIGTDGADDDTDPDDVVAPGTTGKLADIGLSGTPEVAVNVTYAATLTLNDKWVDENGAEYFPIAIKVNTETFKVGEGGIANKAALITAVQEAVADLSENYAPGTNLADADSTCVVTWTWDFEGNDDVKDTFLGDQAAAGNAATIGLTIATTVTQIN